MTVAAILGSAWSRPEVAGRDFEPVAITTGFGRVTLWRDRARPHAWVVFRHGLPHRLLPNQVPYRAHTAALKQIGCEALLVTSSVGVLDPALPLYEPMLVSDLLMPDNRLPDGSACTMFVEPSADQGHLVLKEGLFSKTLSVAIDALVGRTLPRAVFAYVGGPRTKTAAENTYFLSLGAQVNSMSVGPEVVLANELEIPVASLVVGHKHSSPRVSAALGHEEIAESLQHAQHAMDALVGLFLERAQAVPFRNRLHRFGAHK